jgi:menaquinone-specific isochorismate synthase
MDRLGKGGLQKAVPYVFAHSREEMTQGRLCGSLRKALASVKGQAGYLYGRWDKAGGIVGISPELLFAYDRRSPSLVETMAVAGTCLPSEDQEAFCRDPKERHEHELVIEGIRRALHPLGTVKVHSTRLLHLPKLTHLITPIELSLAVPFDFDRLVKALHPTPALGAFPYGEGKKWLFDYEQRIPRGHFGAPIGYRHPESGTSRCFVAIRNVQWDKAGMRIGAGSGVVKQSCFENEWKEVQMKIRATREQLCL